MANKGIDPSAYLGAAGISAGASVGGSIIGAVANYASQQQAFRQNKELMRMQNQYNVDQWNRENQYNSPAAQVARLREAGLNPDLMYGNGTTSTGMASQLSGKMQAGTPMSPVDYSSLALNAAQAGKLFAETRLINSQAEKTGKETSWIDRLNDTSVQHMLSQIAVNDKEIEVQASKIRNMDADSLSKEIDNKFKESQWEKLLRQMDDAHDVTVQQLKNMVQECALTVAQEGLVNAQAALAKWENEMREKYPALAAMKFAGITSGAAPLVAMALDFLGMKPEDIKEFVDNVFDHETPIDKAEGAVEAYKDKKQKVKEKRQQRRQKAWMKTSDFVNDIFYHD